MYINRQLSPLLLMSDDLGARERAAKTAAASRRWREYSRQGVDRQRMRALAARSESEIETDSQKKAAVK